jgi:hypothetical protein
VREASGSDIPALSPGAPHSAAGLCGPGAEQQEQTGLVNNNEEYVAWEFGILKRLQRNEVLDRFRKCEILKRATLNDSMSFQ